MTHEKSSEIKQTRLIFPEALNPHYTLFGGMALKWMDEVAYMTAMQYCNKEMVTVSVENVHFILPVKAGKIIDIEGKFVKRIRNVKLMVRVEIFIDDDVRSLAVYGDFYLSAINKTTHQPVSIRY